MLLVLGWQKGLLAAFDSEHRHGRGMRSANRFKADLKWLERLYAGSLQAYDEARQRIQTRLADGEIGESSAFERILPGASEPVPIAQDPYLFQRYLRIDFPRRFREILFVRLISVVEVYLVDALRELFLSRRDLFKRDESVSISTSHLLSFNSISELNTYLINKELRSLHGGGMSAIAQFYRRRLGIAFSDFKSDYSSVIEYHERRHLLVHRLGRTDSKYRRDYNTQELHVTVGKRYIVGAFKRLEEFGEFVESSLAKLIEEGIQTHIRPEPTAIATVKIAPISEKGWGVVSDEMAFNSDEDVVVLRDLVYARSEGAGEVVLELRGKRKHVSKAIRIFHRHEAADHLKIKRVRFERSIGNRVDNLPFPFLRKIAQQIPQRPIPLEMRREIAERYGIRIKQAARAIRQINNLAPDEIMLQVRRVVRPWPWDICYHKILAEELGISELSAYHALKEIAWEHRNPPRDSK